MLILKEISFCRQQKGWPHKHLFSATNMRITVYINTFHKHLFSCSSWDFKPKVSLNSDDSRRSSSTSQSVSGHFAKLYFHEQPKLRWSLPLWESIFVISLTCVSSRHFQWKFCGNSANVLVSAYEVSTSTNVCCSAKHRFELHAAKNGLINCKHSLIAFLLNVKIMTRLNFEIELPRRLHLICIGWQTIAGIKSSILHHTLMKD